MIPSLIHAIAARLHGDFFLLLPELELLLFAVGMLLIDHWMATKEKYWNAALAMAAVFFSGYTLWMLRGRVAVEGELLGFNALIIVDAFFLFFAVLVLAVLALVILLSAGYRPIPAEREAKYFALLLCAIVGMMLMLSGIDLIIILLGFEIMTWTCHRAMRITIHESQSTRASRPYVMTSAFASVILVFAFAFLVRTAGSTNIGRIGQALDRRAQLSAAPVHADWLVILTVAAILAGLFLKIAALAFHRGAPPRNQTTPAPVAAFITAAAVATSLALLLRLLTVLFGASHDVWMLPLVYIALGLLAFSALAAALQKSVTRLLAYASVSTVGFVLLGLVAGNETALTGIVYYLALYAFINVGAFAVLALLQGSGPPSDSVADFHGLYQRSPPAAILLTVFLLAQAGMPPLAGFSAKYLIMKSLFEAKHPILVAAAALSLLASLLASLRVAIYAWRKLPEPPVRLTMGSAQAVALTIATFATIVAGLYAEPFLRLARYAFGQ